MFIMNQSQAYIIVVAGQLAYLLHHFVLKRVEIDHLTLQLLSVSNVGLVCASYVLGLKFAFMIWTSFYAALSGSILIYRAFSHPLRSFPGPFAAKITKWWAVKETLTSSFTYYKEVQPALWRKYGDYVRTGPRELSIFDANAIQPILGANSKTSKGPFYDVFERNVHLTRDKVWHRQRRRVWDNGMKQSLADYAPRIEEFTTQLHDRIEKAAGGPVPFNEFCIHYSYDVMSALTFGAPMGFNTGQSTDVANRILKHIEGSFHAIGIMLHVPWFMKAVGTLNSSMGPIKMWEQWVRQQLATRRSLKNPQPDLMMHLLSNTPRTPEGDSLLFGEARLIISAGSDTTGNSLVTIFTMLALHPKYQDMLYREYLEEKNYSCLKPRPLLDGVISEAMRLWPSVFFPPQRVTPPEGLQIPNDGPFIPGNTIVTLQGFVIARDERNFMRSNEFIPERWTTKPELCIMKDAFIPFLIGPYVCAGKSLGMMEMRSVVTRLVSEYEVLLPQDFDAPSFFKGIEDHWTIGLPKLKLIFKKRQ
jgi:cytochrome P450